MRDIIEAVLNESNYFHPWPDSNGTTAIPFVWDKGEAPLCLVLGPNGGGKSFFRRLVRLVAHDDWKGVECIHLSMESRAGSSMYGPMRVLVYGDESRCSTGELSSHVIRTGISTCESRGGDHFIYWDEPDIGMGEGESAGAGQEIRAFVENLPSSTRCVYVTSHSRALVRELLPLKPHYVHLGVPADEAPPTLQAWLDRVVVPVSSLELKERASTRYQAILAIINAIKRERHGT